MHLWKSHPAHEQAHGVEKNTLILFTGDNGPWLVQGKSGGSTGLLSGRFSGYWNVGKGSTWEGGIREAGFAHWPGVITPFSRSAQVVSSMDLFPTALELAGVALPDDREYDGKSMVPLLLHDKPSAHELCVPPPPPSTVPHLALGALPMVKQCTFHLLGTHPAQACSTSRQTLLLRRSRGKHKALSGSVWSI